MKVLIVGGGGREHAIALKIKENPEVTALYAAPGNGGIAQIATWWDFCPWIKICPWDWVTD